MVQKQNFLFSTLLSYKPILDTAPVSPASRAVEDRFAYQPHIYPAGFSATSTAFLHTSAALTNTQLHRTVHISTLSLRCCEDTSLSILEAIPPMVLKLSSILECIVLSTSVFSKMVSSSIRYRGMRCVGASNAEKKNTAEATTMLTKTTTITESATLRNHEDQNVIGVQAHEGQSGLTRAGLRLSSHT